MTVNDAAGAEKEQVLCVREADDAGCCQHGQEKSQRWKWACALSALSNSTDTKVEQGAAF